MNKPEPIPKIGLALGSGSSRGWCHIGILNALVERGIVPDVICGCSIGALVAASYANGHLKRLEEWVLSLTRRKTTKYIRFDTKLNGFVNTEKLHHFLNQYVADDDVSIENLPLPFGVVSTELATGREIWFTQGSLIEAVWASISMPGLFPAISNRNRWLVDGGLVNPIPVTLCRSLGADIVIAVNLNNRINGQRVLPAVERKAESGGVVGRIREAVKEYSGSLFATTRDTDDTPGLLESIARSIYITQDRITRSRIAGDPPDLMLTPRLAPIGFLEFHRAAEAITEGKRCVQRLLPDILYVTGRE